MTSEKLKNILNIIKWKGEQKMRKKLLLILLATWLLILTACTENKSQNIEIESEESFYGKVKEVNKENILVELHNEKGEVEEGNLLLVSLDTQLDESDENFTIGDEVTVYYNGVVTRSYPGQVNMVYAIMIQKPAKSEK